MEIINLTKDSEGRIRINLFDKGGGIFYGKLVVRNKSDNRMGIVKLKTNFPHGVASFGSRYDILDPKSTKKILIRLKNTDPESGIIEMQSKSISIEQVPTTEFSPIHLWSNLNCDQFSVQTFGVSLLPMSPSDSINSKVCLLNGRSIVNGAIHDRPRNGLQASLCPQRQNGRMTNGQSQTPDRNENGHPPIRLAGIKDEGPTSARHPTNGDPTTTHKEATALADQELTMDEMVLLAEEWTERETDIRRSRGKESILAKLYAEIGKRLQHRSRLKNEMKMLAEEKDDLTKHVEELKDRLDAQLVKMIVVAGLLAFMIGIVNFS